MTGASAVEWGLIDGTSASVKDAVKVVLMLRYQRHKGNVGNVKVVRYEMKRPRSLGRAILGVGSQRSELSELTDLLRTVSGVSEEPSLQYLWRSWQ